MQYIVLLVIVVVVFAIFGAINDSKKQAKEAQDKAAFNDRTKTRVAAYAEYLRRTSERPDIVAMSDAELHDLLESKIREYKKSVDEGAMVVVAIWGIGGLIGAIIALNEKSWAPFISAAIIAGVAGLLYGFNGEKKIDARFAAQGYEINRLKIDT